jgi:hypothetical protein
VISLRRFLVFVSRFLTRVDLGKDGDYLHRFFVIRTRWRSVFLHRFLRSDEDREFHDHMWSGRSVILDGAYREEKTHVVTNNGIRYRTPIEVHTYDRWSMNTIRTGDFHRVDLLTPEVWTLFIVGPKVQDDWGFLNTDTLEYTDQETFRLNRDGVAPKDID